MDIDVNPFDRNTRSDVLEDSKVSILIGKSDSRKGNEGVNLDSKTTILRTLTVKKIISIVHTQNVILIKSPPMTGKTSMACLTAHHLHRHPTKKNLVINLSILDFGRDGDPWFFESKFKDLTNLNWSDLTSILKNRDIYLILDEVQIMYNLNNSNYVQFEQFQFKRILANCEICHCR